jgi:hypothetical protein
VAKRKNPNQVHTHAAWLVATDVEPMLKRTPMSERKRRLFACACCRRVWSILPDEARRDLETAERMIDREVPKAEQSAAWAVVTEHMRSDTPLAVRAVFSAKVGGCGGSSAAAARAVGDAGLRTLVEERAWQADLLREMVCSPFRPVVVEPMWRTSTVLALAAGIDRESAFDRLPILADALQDAGCDADDLLTHCRDTTLTHVRGCWVVDLVLCKE